MAEYTITRLGHQGDGIAEGPVFVPLALPGEVVTGTLEGQKLVDMRIITPSDDRVAAPCKHYKACGGCQLQHARDAFVADWKTGVVRQALRAQGLWSCEGVARVHCCHVSQRACGLAGRKGRQDKRAALRRLLEMSS